MPSEPTSQNLNVPLLPPIKIIGRKEGLPSGQVHSIACDPLGTFWFAGPGGLAKYDGARIKVFDKKTGLSTHGLRTVTATSDQRLWIGTDNGVDVLEPDGKIHPLVDTGQWPYGFVDKITQISSNTLVFSTSAGLVSWDIDRGAKSYNPIAPLEGFIRAILLDRENRLWVAGPQIGLIFFAGNIWHKPDSLDWIQVGDVHSLALGHENSIYVGGTRGLIEINSRGDVLQQVDIPEEDRLVNHILVQETELWLSIGDKLSTYNSNGKSWDNDCVIFDGVRINDLYGDPSGNIWAATDSQGVFKISALRRSIRNLVLPDTKTIYSIQKTIKDNYLLGGDKCGWSIEMGNPIKAKAINPGNLEAIWDILEDPNGCIWAATDGGLFKIIGLESQCVGENHEVLSSPGRVLLMRQDGLWVGTRTGLAVVNDPEIRRVSIPSGQSFGYVYTLAEDSLGHIWVGTIGQGLWQQKTEGFIRFNAKHILPSGNVYAIAGREDGSLAVLQDDRIVIINKDESTRLLAVTPHSVSGWTVQWGKQDKLWVGSSNGLCVYNCQTGELVHQVSSQFSTEDWEFTTSRSLLFADANHLLCGLNSGLVILDHELLDQFEPLPPVNLSHITWSGVMPKNNGIDYVVEPGRWSVVIDVHVPWFIDEDNLEYRFRLIGLDESWSIWTKQPFLKYSSLPSGRYSLEAQAASPLVGVGPITKLINMEVSYPAWGKVWLSPLVGLSNGISGLFEALGRNHKLLEINEELEGKVKERTLQLEQSNHALQQLNIELDRLSLTDPLTGVGNRRKFNEAFITQLKHAQRTQSPLSLVLVDLDHFKAFNDTYGHLQGDECLREVARALGNTLRGSGDHLSRYGGEEFAILLPDTDITGAEKVAQRLLQSVEKREIPHRSSKTAKIVTISIGVVTYYIDEFSTIIPETIIVIADQALYQAKQTRNRWVSMLVKK